MTGPWSGAAPPSDARRPALWRAVTIGAILLGIAARLLVVTWSHPWEPHHPDEHILPLEAIALWEGVTPREIGWPASTTRLALSGASGVEWLYEQGSAAWTLRGQPDAALANLATWIGKRYVDPMPLYRLGRGVSLATGGLQLVAVAWALGQWVGPVGVALGTLAVAVGPIPVAYSQYVLSDVTGLLFTTILVGLAAAPTRSRILVMAGLAAFGLASKFHFGLWLLTPLLACWFTDDSLSRRWWLSLAVLGIVGWATLTLVPWLWTNPLLALKEIAGVVLVKVGGGATVGQIFRNVATIYSGLGVLLWGGLILGTAALLSHPPKRITLMAIPVFVGSAVLALSATVFDRYGLVLLPGAVVLAALGWERGLSLVHRNARLSIRVVALACVAWSSWSLLAAQRITGDADVDVLTKNWILEHVPRGRRIALHDEDNAFLPRAAEQLRECIARVESLDAYREKWAIEGARGPVDANQPMRSVVLNDEEFSAYWCRRELTAQQDPGFHLVPYHNDPRFGTVLESEAISEFRDGSTKRTGGVDVLVVNRPIDGERPPAQTLRTARGQRVIYLR